MTARTPLRPGDPLPEGWRWVRLGEVVTIGYGKSLPAAKRDPLGPYDVYGSNGLVGKHSSYLTPGPGLIIGRKGSAGEVHYSQRPYWVIDTAFYAVPKKGIDAKWLFYAIKNLQLPKLATGAAIPGINREQIESQNIPLPPLETQHRIVAWLDEAFSHLQAIKERHAEAEREAAALMPAKLAEVFGRAEKEEWRWVRLGEISEIIIGRTPKRSRPEYWGGSNVWVTIADLDGTVVTDSKEHITDLGVRESRARLIPPGTLLMSFKLTVGKLAFAGVPLYTNEAIAALPIKHPGCDSKYLFHALKTTPMLSYAEQTVKGRTLNKRKLRELAIPLPPLETQRRIVEEIETFEEEARRIQKAQEESRATLERLEKSLLAEAFQPERWAEGGG